MSLGNTEKARRGALSRNTLKTGMISFLVASADKRGRDEDDFERNFKEK